jgi:hypothetical protein
MIGIIVRRACPGVRSRAGRGKSWSHCSSRSRPLWRGAWWLHRRGDGDGRIRRLPPLRWPAMPSAALQRQRRDLGWSETHSGCSPAGFESHAASSKSLPVRCRPLVAAIQQWELLEWASSFTCQFVESPVAGRYARAQSCGDATADQPGRRRHRGWRTTPKAPRAGKIWVAAIATPRSALR